MSNKMVDVTLHIVENSTHDERESFRDELLEMDGTLAAAFHDEKPHLVIIEYDPYRVKSTAFVKVARERNWHAELIGF